MEAMSASHGNGNGNGNGNRRRQLTSASGTSDASSSISRKLEGTQVTFDILACDDESTKGSSSTGISRKDAVSKLVDYANAGRLVQGKVLGKIESSSDGIVFSDEARALTGAFSSVLQTTAGGRSSLDSVPLPLAISRIFCGPVNDSCLQVSRLLPTLRMQLQAEHRKQISITAMKSASKFFM